MTHHQRRCQIFFLSAKVESLNMKPGYQHGLTRSSVFRKGVIYHLFLWHGRIGEGETTELALIDGAKHWGIGRRESHFLHGELRVKVAGITVTFLVIAEWKDRSENKNVKETKLSHLESLTQSSKLFSLNSLFLWKKGFIELIIFIVYARQWNFLLV